MGCPRSFPVVPDTWERCRLCQIRGADRMQWRTTDYPVMGHSSEVPPRWYLLPGSWSGSDAMPLRMTHIARRKRNRGNPEHEMSLTANWVSSECAGGQTPTEAERLRWKAPCVS